MNRYSFSLPYSLKLCSEDSWEQLDEECTKFFVVRYHFMVQERPASDNVKRGEILASHEAPEGVEIQKVISLEQEWVITDTRSSVESWLRENEFLQDFSINLFSKLSETPGFNLLPEIKTNCKKIFKNSFQSSLSLESTVSRKRNIKFELNYTIGPHANDKFVSVVAYQKYALDLYLTYIDYLYVDYHKSMMGLRKKRTKYPIVESQHHANEIKFNIPLATVHYWKLLPNSAVMVKQDEYENEVNDPDEIIVKEPENKHRYFVSMPDVPTLYQLSNVAFPLKWIKRKGPWTEEDLKKIEWEEAEGSAWWFKFGPGRK